ncbi:MAG: hypothetical protein Ct9H300mP16_00530 [Pseudomonadota bacterium]|nr:MAG: hypothetical protein Ct9H300mP16_00530 [Pseudomonadota bacterium]
MQSKRILPCRVTMPARIRPLAPTVKPGLPIGGSDCDASTMRGQHGKIILPETPPDRTVQPPADQFRTGGVQPDLTGETPALIQIFAGIGGRKSLVGKSIGRAPSRALIAKCKTVCRPLGRAPNRTRHPFLHAVL